MNWWIWLVLGIPVTIVTAILVLCVAFACCYTFILVKHLSKNDELSKSFFDVPEKPCGNSRQTKKSTNIANYSYAIKYCISKRIYFFDVLRIILTGRYQPSEGENLGKYHKERRKKNNKKDSIISMTDSPFPNITFKPIKQVIQCFHLRRLYHKSEGKSTNMQKNLGQGIAKQPHNVILSEAKNLASPAITSQCRVGEMKCNPRQTLAVLYTSP